MKRAFFSLLFVACLASSALGLASYDWLRYRPGATIADLALAVTVTPDPVNESSTATWSFTRSGYTLLASDPPYSFHIDPSPGATITTADVSAVIDSRMQAACDDANAINAGSCSYDSVTNRVTLSHQAPNPFQVTRTLVSDSLTEGTEIICLSADSPSHGSIASPQACADVNDTSTGGAATIEDIVFSVLTSSAQPSVEGAQICYAISQQGYTPTGVETASFTVAMSGTASAGDFTDILAQALDDAVSGRVGWAHNSSGVLTVSAGVTNPLTVCFQGSADATTEGSETWTMTLSAPDHGTIGGTPATFTIPDTSLTPGVGTTKTVSLGQYTRAGVKVVALNAAATLSGTNCTTHFDNASGVITVSSAGQDNLSTSYTCTVSSDPTYDTLIVNRIANQYDVWTVAEFNAVMANTDATLSGRTIAMQAGTYAAGFGFIGRSFSQTFSVCKHPDVADDVFPIVTGELIAGTRSALHISNTNNLRIGCGQHRGLDLFVNNSSTWIIYLPANNSNLTIRGNRIHGPYLAPNGDYGYSAGNATRGLRSVSTAVQTNLTFSDNVCYQNGGCLVSGYDFAGTIRVERNVFDSNWTDAIQFAFPSNTVLRPTIIIRSNLFQRAIGRNLAWNGAGAHVDSLQYYYKGATIGGVRSDLIIEGNVIMGGPTQSCTQGPGIGVGGGMPPARARVYMAYNMFLSCALGIQASVVGAHNSVWYANTVVRSYYRSCKNYADNVPYPFTGSCDPDDRPESGTSPARIRADCGAGCNSTMIVDSNIYEGCSGGVCVAWNGIDFGGTPSQYIVHNNNIKLGTAGGASGSGTGQYEVQFNGPFTEDPPTVDDVLDGRFCGKSGSAMLTNKVGACQRATFNMTQLSYDDTPGSTAGGRWNIGDTVFDRSEEPAWANTAPP